MDNYVIEMKIRKAGERDALAGASFPLKLGSQAVARGVYNNLVEIIVGLQKAADDFARMRQVPGGEPCGPALDALRELHPGAEF